MEEQAMLATDEASMAFVGRWNGLISTTNWEKGRIICEWREALRESDAPASESSDEAWSQRVGGVTPQHVGRLRRVYERFAQGHDQYRGLFWSHFQAAIDWADAEMYLQGAVDNGWSVSQMREQRWEAMGGSPDQKPQESDIVVTELAEEASHAEEEPKKTVPDTISESVGEVHGTDEEQGGEASEFQPDESVAMDAAPHVADAPAATPVRPFESLPPLPSDLNEAFELFKLAILSHKVSGWAEFSCEDTLAVLESLRQLALAPAGE